MTTTRKGLAWTLRLVLATLLLWQGANARAAVESMRFEIDGQTRRVLLHVPDGGGERPRPLVLVFHGLGDTNTVFADAVQLHRAWPDAIVAYPNGEIRPDRSSQRGWQTQIGQYQDRDLQLVDMLIEEASSRYGTRPEQTYAVGFSNGGHLVFLLMAHRPDAFASFAVVGSIRPDLAGATKPKPFMHLFGKGENRAYKDQWAQTIEAMTRLNRTRGPLTDFAGCCKLHAPAPGGAPFVFGAYNAGHVWPYRGAEWLKTFFTQQWALPADNP
ncbi:alpha/beta hydrolase family esterase [Luteimonas saliphila]|uniref:alpha/beta hydrolase family esterase n=1 Tax=Luteimonas saliphila TaxID=2804919 RepID=UPI00192D651C|nr:alpha/beta hydrolase-fold protein [Luteimonas saliphila]